MSYTVKLTETTLKMLGEIQRRRGRQDYERLRDVILDLSDDPLAKTQPLTGLLAGFRSRHAGRFRVVVRVIEQRVEVVAVGVGWHASGDRDDIYQVLNRMVESGRLSSGD